MSQPEIDLTPIVSSLFEENAFVARLQGREDCVVFDPGLEPEKIITHLSDEGLTPAAILITHGHSDHIGGVPALKQRWPDCPVVIGSGDALALTDPQLNLSAAFGLPLTCGPADVTVEDGQTYSAAGFDFQVRAISGHSPGHVVYLWEAHSPTIVFVGDVIFSGSIGRHDFPGGSFRQLADGIHQKLFTLPDDTILLPGHGPSTTVGREKRTNPFVGLNA
ncbi:MAG: MBL fold metallo-hydrolase [Pirellulales bacterium]|nr:MBL fold metallo-hydrolase [Pirellulales bacterium]